MDKYPAWFRYKVSSFSVGDRPGHPTWNSVEEMNKTLIELGIDATDVISIQEHASRRDGHFTYPGGLTVFYREKNET